MPKSPSQKTPSGTTLLFDLYIILIFKTIISFGFKFWSFKSTLSHEVEEEVVRL